MPGEAELEQSVESRRLAVVTRAFELEVIAIIRAEIDQAQTPEQGGEQAVIGTFFDECGDVGQSRWDERSVGQSVGTSREHHAAGEDGVEHVGQRAVIPDDIPRGILLP